MNRLSVATKGFRGTAVLDRLAIATAGFRTSISGPIGVTYKRLVRFTVYVAQAFSIGVER